MDLRCHPRSHIEIFICYWRFQMESLGRQDWDTYIVLELYIVCFWTDVRGSKNLFYFLLIVRNLKVQACFTTPNKHNCKNDLQKYVCTSLILTIPTLKILEIGRYKFLSLLFHSLLVSRIFVHPKLHPTIWCVLYSDNGLRLTERRGP